MYSDMRRRSRGEALMAVPRRSAPVFGRYAGVQGVQSWQSWHSWWERRQTWVSGLFLKCCWQRGKALAGRGESYNTEPVLPPELTTNKKTQTKNKQTTLFGGTLSGRCRGNLGREMSGEPWEVPPDVI